MEKRNIEALTDSTTNAAATAIAINGADVYVTGYITNAQGVNVAISWKNGILTNLSDGSDDGIANALCFANGDVYIAGTFARQAVYWKNGVIKVLDFGSARAITSNGTDIYVAGAKRLGSVTQATYWKNGTPTSFSPYLSTVSANINAIAVNGSDVYATGVDGSAEVWKNGVAQALPGGAACYPFAIAVIGSNTYVAGFTNNFTNSYATYWKNGIATNLTDGNSYASLKGVAVNSSDIYFVGNIGTKITYWKNGTLVQQKTGNSTGIALVAQ